ncbi:hypothetical protein OAD66_03760 [Bacteroidia bacterium]|nr:hypothetical protein [Bacteroidia bacterium]
MEKIAERTQSKPDYKDATKDIRDTPMYSSLGLNTGVNLSYSIPTLSNEAVATEWRSGASITLMKESLIEYDKRTQRKHKYHVLLCRE